MSHSLQDGADDGDNIIKDGGSGTNGNGSDSLSPQQSETTTTAAQQQLSDTNSLLVDISDALSEKERVKFTVHTRTKIPGYAKPDFFVVRQHEEFVWLHDRFEENEEYAGYIVGFIINRTSCCFCLFLTHIIFNNFEQIPPCPPKPDFDASREKLQRLGEGEGNMTKEEFKKMKQELEA